MSTVYVINIREWHCFEMDIYHFGNELNSPRGVSLMNFSNTFTLCPKSLIAVAISIGKLDSLCDPGQQAAPLKVSLMRLMLELQSTLPDPTLSPLLTCSTQTATLPLQAKSKANFISVSLVRLWMHSSSTDTVFRLVITGFLTTPHSNFELSCFIILSFFFLKQTERKET